MNTPNKPQSVSEFVLLCRLALREDFGLELARLAATMAPRQAGLDSDALIENALRLRECAAIKSAARLSELIAGFPEDFLWDAHTALMSVAPKLRDKLDEDLMSKIRIEATRLHEEKRAPLSNAEREVWEQSVAAVEAESGTTRPSLPCGRWDAIRWVTSADPSIPWPIIQDAFLKWLEVGLAKERKIAINDVLLKEATYYADCYWNEKHPCDLQTLSELCEGFRRFWREGDFEQSHQAAIQSKKLLAQNRSLTNSQGGKNSVKVRARKRWMGVVNDFHEWLDLNQGRATPESVEDFLKTRKVGRAALKSEREFLGTLTVAISHPETREDFSSILAGRGVRVSQETANECFELMGILPVRVSG